MSYQSLKHPKSTFPLLVLLISVSCSHNAPLMQQISSSKSGIHFSNTIIENDSVNQLDNGNVFNGGGVGIGDFNNDGLQDIYFTSSLGSNKLYLNKGSFTFQDVTEEASVTGEGRWSRGVAITDVNSDGLPDIYVSATIWNNPEQRRNLLYINQGTSGESVPHFKELAAEYGLDDDSHTTQAAFFDYDNDGDIDVYLTVNEINDRNSPYIFRPVQKNSVVRSSGHLYRNDFDSAKGHPVFTDVSEVAGIRAEGFGNQASVTDINLDGWKDIYVTNDFISADLLWINNKNGTFTERLASAFKHNSNSAMGNDVGDINNDGLQDIISLDMNPEDNYRKKMMLLPASYQFFQNSDQFGYVFQYTRNTLQLNMGVPPSSDSLKLPVFSDVSFYAGTDGTDWSWTPLLADFDNDGYRDIFIANGFPRDITDRDFGMYRSKAWATTPIEDIIKQIPEVKIHNYIYRNNGDLTFRESSAAWGLGEPTFSNGAACADFDNDGDADLVVNNINMEASLYRNNSRERKPAANHFLKVNLKGNEKNPDGLGAFIEIYYSGNKQIWENSPFRGYISTVEKGAHFGLGLVEKVDSLIVRWQNGKIQVLKNVPADQFLTLSENDATNKKIQSSSVSVISTLFKDVTKAKELDWVHSETDFVDFNIQKLIPRKYSESGPALETGDINGDGLEDLITGGSAGNSATIFLQKPDGSFAIRQLLKADDFKLKSWDDAGLLLFDADGDNDKDLLILSGGYENEPNSTSYTDHFYINDGKGNYSEDKNALPQNRTSKSVVRASDIDQDGDPDLFIGGRVDPWNYPRQVKSSIYRNDSSDGKCRFTEATSVFAHGISLSGMVTDALFSDFNGDGTTDLILSGEWMPLTFLANENGKFKNVTNVTNPAGENGWWNSLCAADFDNDGDTDYVAGNLGLNSYYRASPACPVSVFSADFDNNGSMDAFPAHYIATSQTDTTRKNYPVFGRDDAVKQMISLRSRFQNYKSFASATINELFTPDQLKKAEIVTALEMRSCLFRNEGNNVFTRIPLPAAAQLSMLNEMIAGDFNGDGKTDLVISTNDFGTEVLTGRYDALNGLVLEGDGKCGFRVVPMQESGFFVPGNGRGMKLLKDNNGSVNLVASENRGPLRIFKINHFNSATTKNK